MFRIVTLERGKMGVNVIALNIPTEIRAEQLLDKLSADYINSDVLQIKTCKHNKLLQFVNGQERLLQIQEVKQ